MQGRAAEALLCDTGRPTESGLREGWSHAASACRILGRFDEAVADWRRAPEIDPASLEVVSHLGSTLQEMGYSEECSAYMSKPRRFTLSRLRFTSAWAVALRHLGQHHRSAECFRQALGRDPRDARVHNDLGELLWRNGDAAGAMACFQRAIEITPGLAAAHFNLANAFREAGRLDEAETGYRTALSLDPLSVGPLTNLAITLCDQGRTAEVRGLFEQMHVFPGRSTSTQSLAGRRSVSARRHAAESPGQPRSLEPAAHLRCGQPAGRICRLRRT